MKRPFYPLIIFFLPTSVHWALGTEAGAAAVWLAATGWAILSMWQALGHQLRCEPEALLDVEAPVPAMDAEKQGLRQEELRVALPGTADEVHGELRLTRDQHETKRF